MAGRLIRLTEVVSQVQEKSFIGDCRAYFDYPDNREAYF
jgi:hypothetical protein